MHDVVTENIIKLLETSLKELVNQLVEGNQRIYLLYKYALRYFIYN